MRRTKIICTIGPKTASYEAIEKLADGGMNVARINMSHGDHAWHREVIRHVHHLNEKGKYSVALMLDTKGPEVRSGDVIQPVHLKKGSVFTFTSQKRVEYPIGMTEVSYDGFIDDANIGDTVLVDGGMISFKVTQKTEKDLVCECLDEGILTSRRHLNIRGKSARLPSITPKDWEDIDFGIKEGVDFIALSFVKNAAAIKELKDYLENKNVSMQVIAKIESAAALPHLLPILKAADGVMVARGDLGAEIPLEEVPILQEKIVKHCRELNKPVIVATHLLESMIQYPTPTRAEVTDIAEAVREGADAIMLSGETASGNYPYKALEVMVTVAKRIEQELQLDLAVHMQASSDASEQIVYSATVMGNNLKSDAILVFTRRGYMATLLSRCRPNSPIYAITNTPHVRRRMNLIWGICPFRVEFSRDPETTIQRAITALKEKKLLKTHQRIIVVSDILAEGKMIDTVQIRTV